MQKYIDAHCHYTTPMSPVVGAVFNSATMRDWRRADDAPYAGAIGIHPWYLDELAPDWDAQMAQLLRANPGLMVGEIGLDVARGDITRQIPVFVRQMALAHEFGRVAHIHCVRAWDRMLHVLAAGKLPPAIVFHSFRGNDEIAGAILQHANAYFSFGPMCDARSVCGVDMERILVESDAAAPGAAADALSRAVSRIAEFCHMTPESVSEIIYNNTMGIIQNARQITQNTPVVG